MQKTIGWLSVFALSLGLALAFDRWLYFPIGGDWVIFRAAALDPLRMYSQQYYSVPWLALALYPLAILPAKVGALVVFALNMTGFLFAFYRLRIPPILCAPLLWMILHGAIFGNIEGLVILGLFLPSPLAVFVLLAKPQMTAGVLLYIAWQAYHNKHIIATFAPACIAICAGVLIFGVPGTPINESWNASIFPYGILPGLIILWYAITRRNIGAALACGPLFSPYVNSFTGWAALWIGLACALTTSGIIKIGEYNYENII